MANKRVDSFKIALETLRDELRSGAHAAGARLTANEIAGRLSLSQTPVREALSRLAGEGLLQDRRGQGFFVRSLTERDLATLLRGQLELLLIACDIDRPPISNLDLDRLVPGGAHEATPGELVHASERLFRIVAAASSPPLARHLGRFHDQLAPVRAGEPRVLDRLPEEFDRLSGAILKGDPIEIRAALRGFFRRRIRAAPALIRLQDTAENYSADIV